MKWTRLIVLIVIICVCALFVWRISSEVPRPQGPAEEVKVEEEPEELGEAEEPTEAAEPGEDEEPEEEE